ncbi:hypothetical protein MEZE111188_06385 [Mesobacillus zeae]
MNNCHLLEISFDYNGQKQVITPVILQDENETILVDCGYPDFVTFLKDAAFSKGVNLDSITKIIITHHDMDHIGSLAALKREYPQIEIISYEFEAPYIEGVEKSLRLQQAESTLDELPGEEKENARQFIHFLKSIEPAKVDRTVSDNEELPWCGGIKILHTPGHMPGHISLYLPASKTLIAGDAVVIETGKLEIANPQFTFDMEAALSSVQLLLDYDIKNLICYHGGLFQGNVKEALIELVHSYRSKSSSVKEKAMQIRQLDNHKQAPLDLLLLADPSQQLVEEYIKRGKCFAAYSGENVVGVYVLLPTRPDTIELVNVAVAVDHQGKGIGKQLVNHAVRQAQLLGFKTIEVGTGNSSVAQLALYQKCGFRITGVDKDFFIRHYTEEIFENGMQVVDMIRLSQDL